MRDAASHFQGQKNHYGGLGSGNVIVSFQLLGACMAFFASGSDPTAYIVDMRRPGKQARYRRYMHMECEVRSIKYKACSRDMHME